jgi:hypothetical protein
VIGAAPIAGLALAQLVPAKPTITRALTPVALPFINPNGGGMMLAQALCLALCLQPCVRYESSRGSGADNRRRTAPATPGRAWPSLRLALIRELLQRGLLAA